MLAVSCGVELKKLTSAINTIMHITMQEEKSILALLLLRSLTSNLVNVDDDDDDDLMGCR
jgi:hypothetical protein